MKKSVSLIFLALRNNKNCAIKYRRILFKRLKLDKKFGFVAKLIMQNIYEAIVHIS